MIFQNSCTGHKDRCKYRFDTERVSEGSMHGACSDTNAFDTLPHPVSGTGVLCRDAWGAGQDLDPPSPPLDVDDLGNQHDQSYSPAYIWGNTHNGGTGNVEPHNDAQVLIKENRDYFLDDSASTGYGLGGMTIGVLSDAPACNDSTEYHGHWATDKGANWNSTAEWGGEDGALYVCNGEGEWELYYTPASYPHPLVRSYMNSQTPSAPGNLRIE